MEFLNKSSAKIQTTWIYLTIARNLGIPLMVVGFVFSGLWYLAEEPSDSAAVTQLTELLAVNAVLFIRGVIATSLLYWTAISKRENWLLIINLIATPALFIKDLVSYEYAVAGEMEIMFLLLDIVVTGWWYLFSIRLMRVNKALKVGSVDLPQAA